MKYRADFVTNSSSSSFVIAFKDFPRVPEELLTDYPYLKLAEQFIHDLLMEEHDYETSSADVVYNKVDLDNYIAERYDYMARYDEESEQVIHRPLNELLGQDEYLKKMYDDSLEYLEKGYRLLFKDVDYHDTRVNELIDMLLWADGVDFHLVRKGY